MLPVIHPPPSNTRPFEWLKTDETAVPMLPAIALKVIELVSDPDVTVTSLAPVVSKDQVLASRVLGLGNSAAYAGYQPATTLLALLQSEGYERLDAVKLDVEGAEDLILEPFLRDAPEALWPSFIIIEDSRERWQMDLVGLLTQRGYRMLAQTRLNLVFERDAA